MWRLRRALAAASIHGAACVSATALAGGVTGADTIDARIVEVGDAGRVRARNPAPVRVGITTERRFRGTFAARLERPREGGHLDSPGAPSTTVRFLLEAGESRELIAYLPNIPDDVCYGVELRWSLADADGRQRLGGTQPVQCIPFSSAASQLLYLTNAPLPARRPPAAAFAEAQAYAGYGALLISGLDFAGLREEYQEALLDRTALGSVLVLTAPLAAPGHGLEPRLASAQALVWRDSGGREAREIPLHLGFVRTIDRLLPDLASAPDAALFRLLTSAGPIEPIPDDRGFRRLPDEDPWERAGTVVDLRRARTALAGSGLLLLALGAAAVWCTSRPRAAAPAGVVAVAVVLLAISPGLVYVAASSARTGNDDRCWDLVLHDMAGGWQSRWTKAGLGGGGGTADPAIVLPASAHARWWASRGRDFETSVDVDQDLDGRLRFGLGRRGLSFDRLLVVQRAEATASEPVWDVEGTALRGDNLVGSVRARRPFERMAIVGPAGVAWFGSVRAGERIDLSAARWLDGKSLATDAGGPSERLRRRLWALPGAEEERIERAASRLMEVSPSAPVRNTIFYALGSESAPCTISSVAGGAPPPPCTVHVQPIFAEQATAADRMSWLPVERQGQDVHVRVPTVIWERMRARGFALRPEVRYLDERSEPDVSPGAIEGFCDVRFRVSGAPDTSWPGGRATIPARWRRGHP